MEQKKPPVLSEDELRGKAMNSLVPITSKIELTIAHNAARDQLDDTWQKAQAIYGPLIQQAEIAGWRKGNELKQKRLNIKLKMARQETAREIFEWIKAHKSTLKVNGYPIIKNTFVIPEKELQSYESRYLKEAFCSIMVEK